MVGEAALRLHVGLALQLQPTPHEFKSMDVIFKRRLTGQLRTVLLYLIERGSITNREAMLSLGVGRLASRISELRALGVAITNACPEKGKRYVAYRLENKHAARRVLTAGAPPHMIAAEIMGDVSEPALRSVGCLPVSPVRPSNRAAPDGMSNRGAGGDND